jgi:hypothetical protein
VSKLVYIAETRLFLFLLTCTKQNKKIGLTAKNQRKLAKAVKRARAMGLMSSTNNHSEFKLN